MAMDMSMTMFFCVSDSDAEIQDDDGVEEVFIHLENV